MTHYETLGVNSGATIEQIKSAYLQNMSEVSQEHREEIQQAYNVLIDPTAKEMYDDYLVKVDEFREEAKYQHFVQQQEENQLNDGTLISKWTKLYRLDWREFASLTREDKISKFWAELFFRSLYGLVGIFIVFLFLLYAGRVVLFFTFIFSPDGYILRYVFAGTFFGFFFSAKLYRKIFENWRMNTRSE